MEIEIEIVQKELSGHRRSILVRSQVKISGDLDLESIRRRIRL